MRELSVKPEACPIRSVVVYLQGAQVRRAGTLTLPEGECRVVLERLPAGLLPESIQAAMGEGGEILSVEHRINHLVEVDWDQDIQRLREELEALEGEARHRRAMLEVCRGQEEMLAANRSMAGSEAGLRASELREGVGFFRECMEEIKTRQLGLEQELEELERRMARLRGQLGDMSGKRARPVSEIVLRAGSAAGGEVALDLSYFVGEAGWAPGYDVRARDTDSPIRLCCKAGIAQSTGEDWEGVELTISTGSPSGNALCPAPEPEPVGAAVDRSLTTVDYHIPTPCTILSGQGEQVVEMVAHEVAAGYQYRSVRKLDKEVYLIAKVRDYAKLNLVAGEANVFFGSKFVGRTFIDPRKGEETIDWSLGADPSVVVTRHKGKSYSAGGLGGNRKVTREWELTARNLKDRPIQMQLRDQVPVSANRQIQVEVAEVSGAEHDKDRGILTWEFELAPGAARSFKVRYVVIHPKQGVVLLD